MLCGSVPGELVLGHETGDSPAYALIEDLDRKLIRGVDHISSLAERLLHAGVEVPISFGYELHLLKTQPGAELSAINDLHAQYARQVINAMARGPGWTPSIPKISMVVEPNALLRLEGPSGFSFDQSLHKTYASLLGLPDRSNSRGSGVTVAIVDSGIIPNLQQHIDQSRSKCFFKTDPAGAIDDDDGHGTAIAEIVRAVAPDATLRVLKVTDGNAFTAWDALAGLAAAAGAEVINLSFSFELQDRACQGCGYLSKTTRSAVFEAILERVFAANTETVVIVAAGNDSQGGQTEFRYPGLFRDVLVVGALTSSRSRASTSNYGTKSHVPGDQHPNVFFAPGGGDGEVVGTTSPPAVDRFGTSFAAAYVSGLVAVYLGRPALPDRTRDATLAFFKQHADRSMCKSVTAPDPELGHGMIRLA